MEWQDSGPERPRHSNPGRTLFVGRLVAAIVAQRCAGSYVDDMRPALPVKWPPAAMRARILRPRL